MYGCRMHSCNAYGLVKGGPKIQGLLPHCSMWLQSTHWFRWSGPHWHAFTSEGDTRNCSQ
ncbi:hypothetical protein DPMN_139269 [Dreissena polymorpha]|uniref:Uncharacterized protein n=1 Tax=Dreissena polymorpha TaxID=45954 RepID=A0A9D4G5P0_DREPO|nr:hypothetical protein DPMN_139269 [Dreissena polymorpha]